MSPVLSGDARSAVFAPVADTMARGDAVSRRLAAAIALGLVDDGEQLPPETELAQALNVSTVTLRSALQGLRDLGLVETRRGRSGGSFARVDDDSLALLSRTRLAEMGVHEIRELGDLQSAVLGTCAALAAERASVRELARLRQITHDLARAGTATTLRRLDGRFHIELSAASQSARLTQLEVELQGELAQLSWHRSQHQPDRLANDRWTLVVALERRDVAGARALAEESVAAGIRSMIENHLSLTRDLPDGEEVEDT